MEHFILPNFPRSADYLTFSSVGNSSKWTHMLFLGRKIKKGEEGDRKKEKRGKKKKKEENSPNNSDDSF